MTLRPSSYGDSLVSLGTGNVHLRVGIDDRHRNVVEDVAVVVAGRVGDVDDVDARQPFLGLGLRTLDHGRRFANVHRFLDFFQMIEGYLDFERDSGFDGGDGGIVSLLLDAELAKSFGNVRNSQKPEIPVSHRRARDGDGVGG